MAVIELSAKDRFGDTKRLLIHGDAIAYVDATADEKVIYMKSGDVFWCACQAGWWSDGKSRSEISLHQTKE